MEDEDLTNTEKALANIIRSMDRDIDSESTVSPIIENPDQVLNRYMESVKDRTDLPINKELQTIRPPPERPNEETTRRVNDEWIRIGFREAKANYALINSHIVQIKKTLIILHRILIESMPKGGTTESHRRAHEILAKKLAAEQEAKDDWVKIFKELKHKTILAGLWATGVFILSLLGFGAYTQLDKYIVNAINKNNNVVVNSNQQPTPSPTQGKTK